MVAARRLAAIMITDIVGFSAIAHRDEPLSLALVEEQRAIVRSTLPAHQGREVKTMGDGFLLEFSTAIDATRCAIEIQRAMDARNRSVRGERLALRVGIHVGDVTYRA
ncbi:MAG: adenylate/guanylate cyclase domain-containing protein, partial [Thermoplasmata archaeon]